MDDKDHLPENCTYKYPKDCPVCSLTDPTSLQDDVPWPTLENMSDRGYSEVNIARQLRIEALHAASRITAGALQAPIPRGSIGNKFKGNGEEMSIDEWTIFNAEQFAKWLETGEK